MATTYNTTYDEKANAEAAGSGALSGAAGGVLAGAAAGAAIGSVVPVVGTIVGGLVGAAIMGGIGAGSASWQNKISQDASIASEKRRKTADASAKVDQAQVAKAQSGIAGTPTTTTSTPGYAGADYMGRAASGGATAYDSFKAGG